MERKDTFELRRLLKFDHPFTFEIPNGDNFTVWRITLRRLTCIHSKVYHKKGYTMRKDHSLYINATGTTYEEHEYDLNSTSGNQSAVVCLKLSASLPCRSSFISLRPEDFLLLPNLTIVNSS